MSGRKHTVSAFDDELNALHDNILELGGLAVAALDDAMAALRTNDLARARRVVAADAAIDALHARAEALAVNTIALRAPMADDLRTLVAAIKVAALIARTADYAKNIARRVPQVTARCPERPRAIADAMHARARAMLTDVIAAFDRDDTALSRSVRDRDEEVDDLHEQLTCALVELMIDEPRRITEATHLLFIGKHLERIGDQATNIAEMVIYVATGDQPAARGTTPDRIAA